MQDTVYVVLSGRIVLTHPNKVLMDIIAEGPKALRERVEILSDRQTQRNLKTFITAQTGKDGKNSADYEMRNQRLAEAKTKNTTFQLFDKMLGIEKDPKLAKIREENPLNKITVPDGQFKHIDERIDLFNTPFDQDSHELHPLMMSVTP